MSAVERPRKNDPASCVHDFIHRPCISAPDNVQHLQTATSESAARHTDCGEACDFASAMGNSSSIHKLRFAAIELLAIWQTSLPKMLYESHVYTGCENLGFH